MDSIISNRYFTYSDYIKILGEVLSSSEVDFFVMEEIGFSVLNKPIYKLELGTGSKRILMWSQMHGNESTTTKALLPFIKWFLNSRFKLEFKLYIIPVLNPDGLSNWSRENANQMDLNRDAQDLSQPESRILRSVFNSVDPDYCFNLHDQRTIYGTPDGAKPVQCSFLAPAADESRTITDSRATAMYIINSIVKGIEPQSTGVIGRYGDAFNNNCVGDTFQALGVPTVLFEAGHADQDYYRIESMRVITQSLQTAIESIHSIDQDFFREKVIKEYHAITSIDSNFCDILIKNVPSLNGKVNLSIMYREVLQDDILYFIPVLSGIDDASVKNAHRVIDFNEDVDLIDFKISIDQRFISNNLDINIFY